MKRILALFLCVVLLFPVGSVYAFADGKGNMDDGGGDMGNGTGQNFWNPGNDGVRVTIVRASDNKPVSRSIDLTNKNESNIRHYFKQKCKLFYRAGSRLEPAQSKYTYENPVKKMPRIITSNGGNANISKIKKYFCSEWVIKRIAEVIGTTYEKLTDGKYKLLLEPIGYFTFNGAKWAMTATEAALYDRKISGRLRQKMLHFSHQNLPLAMFLERSDMGYPAYKGSKNKPQSDSTIIGQLGLGIVKFKEDPTPTPQPGKPGESSATYRVNTDVVTSVTLSSDNEINPDSPASVTFHILGSSCTRTNIVIPKGESQLVWVKWHTPRTPQTVTIRVTSSKGSLSAGTITAKVENLVGHEPPDPTATDRNDSFQTPDVPEKAASASRSWNVWSAKWHQNWKWHEHWVWNSDRKRWEDNGWWVKDGGYWIYTSTEYRAVLSSSMRLLPDDKDPTAKGKLMKSGYGVKISVSGRVRTSSSTANITGAQTAVTYFPEFSYRTYWRLLDPKRDGLSSAFHFKINQYSTYGRRVHFTPLWYPDGTYTAYTYLEDAWTPAGMLSANLTDYVKIKGNVYDDWHVGPQMVD
jgi:hypothetical protein